MLEALLALEGENGLENSIPQGTKILSIKLAGGVCTLDLTAEFLEGCRTAEQERMAVREIVATLSALPEVETVDLLVEGLEPNYRDDSLQAVHTALQLLVCFLIKLPPAHPLRQTARGQCFILNAHGFRVRYFFCWRRTIPMNLTSYVQDRQLTIALRGEIDHHAAREIMQALSAKIDLYLPLRCILDFRDVTFMDSSGIAVVIHTLRRMNTLQGRLLLQNIPAPAL